MEEAFLGRSRLGSMARGSGRAVVIVAGFLVVGIGVRQIVGGDLREGLAVILGALFGPLIVPTILLFGRAIPGKGAAPRSADIGHLAGWLVLLAVTWLLLAGARFVLVTTKPGGDWGSLVALGLLVVGQVAMAGLCLYGAWRSRRQVP